MVIELSTSAHHDGILALEFGPENFFVQEFGKSVETVTIGDFGEERNAGLHRFRVF